MSNAKQSGLARKRDGRTIQEEDEMSAETGALELARKQRGAK